MNDAHMMTTNRSAKKRHNPALQSLCNEVTEAVTVIVKLPENTTVTADFVSSLYEGIKVNLRYSDDEFWSD